MSSIREALVDRVHCVYDDSTRIAHIYVLTRACVCANLIAFFKVKQSGRNHMTASNLGIAIGPTLFCGIGQNLYGNAMEGLVAYWRSLWPAQCIRNAYAICNPNGAAAEDTGEYGPAGGTAYDSSNFYEVPSSGNGGGSGSGKARRRSSGATAKARRRSSHYPSPPVRAKAPTRAAPKRPTSAQPIAVATVAAAALETTGEEPGADDIYEAYDAKPEAASAATMSPSAGTPPSLPAKESTNAAPAAVNDAAAAAEAVDEHNPFGSGSDSDDNGADQGGGDQESYGPINTAGAKEAVPAAANDAAAAAKAVDEHNPFGSGSDSDDNGADQGGGDQESYGPIITAQETKAIVAANGQIDDAGAKSKTAVANNPFGDDSDGGASDYEVYENNESAVAAAAAAGVDVEAATTTSAADTTNTKEFNPFGSDSNTDGDAHDIYENNDAAIAEVNATRGTPPLDEQNPFADEEDDDGSYGVINVDAPSKAKEQQDVAALNPFGDSSDDDDDYDPRSVAALQTASFKRSSDNAVAATNQTMVENPFGAASSSNEEVPDIYENNDAAVADATRSNNAAAVDDDGKSVNPFGSDSEEGDEQGQGQEHDETQRSATAHADDAASTSADPNDPNDEEGSAQDLVEANNPFSSDSEVEDHVAVATVTAAASSEDATVEAAVSADAAVGANNPFTSSDDGEGDDLAAEDAGAATQAGSDSGKTPDVDVDVDDNGNDASTAHLSPSAIAPSPPSPSFEQPKPGPVESPSATPQPAGTGSPAVTPPMKHRKDVFDKRAEEKKAKKEKKTKKKKMPNPKSKKKAPPPAKKRKDKPAASLADHDGRGAPVEASSAASSRFVVVRDDDGSGAIEPVAKPPPKRNPKRSPSKWEVNVVNARNGRSGEPAEASSDADAPTGPPCDMYQVDLVSAIFGMCKCGHPKSAHSESALGAGASARPRSATVGSAAFLNKKAEAFDISPPKRPGSKRGGTRPKSMVASLTSNWNPKASAVWNAGDGDTTDDRSPTKQSDPPALSPNSSPDTTASTFLCAVFDRSPSPSTSTGITKTIQEPAVSPKRPTPKKKQQEPDDRTEPTPAPTPPPATPGAVASTKATATPLPPQSTPKTAQSPASDAAPLSNLEPALNPETTPAGDAVPRRKKKKRKGKAPEVKRRTLTADALSLPTVADHWTPEHVCTWLRITGLPLDGAKVKLESITGRVLLQLDGDDLRELEVFSKLQQKKVLTAIAQLDRSHDFSVVAVAGASDTSATKAPDAKSTPPAKSSPTILKKRSDRATAAHGDPSPSTAEFEQRAAKLEARERALATELEARETALAAMETRDADLKARERALAARYDSLHSEATRAGTVEEREEIVPAGLGEKAVALTLEETDASDAETEAIAAAFAAAKKGADAAAVGAASLPPPAALTTEPSAGAAVSPATERAAAAAAAVGTTSAEPSAEPAPHKAAPVPAPALTVTTPATKATAKGDHLDLDSLKAPSGKSVRQELVRRRAAALFHKRVAAASVVQRATRAWLARKRFTSAMSGLKVAEQATEEYLIRKAYGNLISKGGWEAKANELRPQLIADRLVGRVVKSALVASVFAGMDAKLAGSAADLAASQAEAAALQIKSQAAVAKREVDAHLGEARSAREDAEQQLASESVALKLAHDALQVATEKAESLHKKFAAETAAREALEQAVAAERVAKDQAKRALTAASAAQQEAEEATAVETLSKVEALQLHARSAEEARQAKRSIAAAQAAQNEAEALATEYKQALADAESNIAVERGAKEAAQAELSGAAAALEAALQGSAAESARAAKGDASFAAAVTELADLRIELTKVKGENKQLHEDLGTAEDLLTEEEKKKEQAEKVREAALVLHAALGYTSNDFV